VTVAHDERIRTLRAPKWHFRRETSGHACCTTRASMQQPMPERRRLLEKVAREIARHEAQAIEHPHREVRRIGEAPPVLALRDVADHAERMRARFEHVVVGHSIAVPRNGATLSTLRHVVVDRVIDPERSYRTALLDLQHGVDVVKLMRDLARMDLVFGVIRWCDDWLTVRRRLITSVEAQLDWFAIAAGIDD
jgi:hypothetical protein